MQFYFKYLLHFFQTLITKYNELKDGRFVDPKSKKVFKYDHLRKDATEVLQAGSTEVDENLEPWRRAVQQVFLLFCNS